MVFSSEVFLFIFLPCVLVIYYALLRKTKKLKNIFLLAASLFFYAWGESKHVVLMICVILLNWFFGILVDKLRDDKKAAMTVLTLMAITNVGILGWYKYSVFTVLQINRFFHTEIPVPAVTLPIGISFFIFQAMSYVVDVYRRDGKVQKNPLQVGLYVSFFPQLIAGPIVRYETIAEQIENRVENFEDFSAGVTRFCIGLGKKVIIANNMAVIADYVFDMLINEGGFQASVAMAWLGIISYSLQIFFDFAGYSDMAIGLGMMFGFRFKENFNYPFMASSVTDLWRRWHISLSSWFRDYVYIPLGGSRVPKVRQIFNIFVVWLLTGVWHGANWTFIAWGLLFFVFLTFEKISGFNKKKTWWGHIYVILVFMFVFVFFRSTGIGAAIAYLKAMVGIGARGLYEKAVWAYIAQNWFYYIVAIISCAPIIPWLDKRLSKYKVWHVIYAAGIVAILIISVSFISNNAYNPFIYFNF